MPFGTADYSACDVGAGGVGMAGRKDELVVAWECGVECVDVGFECVDGALWERGGLPCRFGFCGECGTDVEHVVHGTAQGVVCGLWKGF